MSGHDVSESLPVATQFLDRVLPANGFRCAYVVDGAKKYNVFFARNEDLARYLLQGDADRKTVYHACSSFRVNAHDARGTPRSERVLGRTHRNVLECRAFWADVDCGEGKPYRTAGDAAEHVVRFCAWAHLPAPLFVGSGHGLHLYWPLDQGIPPETWKRYSTGLAALFDEFGLQVDRTRTADPSSVLRTPGTHHRKSGDKQVVCGPLVGPYSLEQFERLLNDAHVPVRRDTPLHRLPSPRGDGAQSGVPQSITSDILGGIYDEIPADAGAVADQCAVIRTVRDTKGAVSEPVWYGALGVIAHCADAGSVSHEWSSGHPNYSVAETDERLARAAEFGPTTCAKFRSLNPAGCFGCKFSGRITSPIQLGRRAVDDRDDRGPQQQAADNPLFSLPEGDGEQIAVPPEGFYYDDKGRLSAISEDKNGGAVYDLICEYPIYLKAIHTGEMDSERYGYLFREKKLRTGWRDISVSARQAAGRDSATEMAERGVTIHDAEAWRRYVRGAVDQWHKMNDLARRYDQFGWKEDETRFLVGKRLYTPTDVISATGSQTLESRANFMGPSNRKDASLERWTRAASKLFQAGLEHQSLGVLCGFAAPIMRFHSSGEGGAIVSFVSDHTASGKTTALEAAASIWGDKRGVKLDETDTRVAKGLKLGILGNLPCTFDELHERDPELIRQFVLIFTNGSDKDRGTQDGGLRINKSDWQTILLTASNTSLVDILSNMDASDAPAARIMEFNTALPSHIGKDDFDHIKRELDHNCGYAGDAFVKKLVQPEIVEWLRTNLPVWSDMVRREAGLDEKHRFWVRLMVSVMAAGRIVEQMGIVDFSADRISKWLIRSAAGMAHSIQGATGDDAAARLATFMSEAYNDTLVVDSPFVQGKRCMIIKAPTRNILCRFEVNPRRLYISEKHLKRWLVKNGVNTGGFFSRLLEQRVIIGEQRKMTLGAGTDLATGQVPSVMINMAHPAVSGIAVDLEKLSIVRPDPPRLRPGYEHMREVK